MDGRYISGLYFVGFSFYKCWWWSSKKWLIGIN